MHVLVVGATGNAGNALLRRLAPDVDQLTGIARRTPVGRADEVRWVEADLLTSDLDPLLRDVDVVVHLAWLIQPSRRPDRTWDVNVRGTERLLAAVARSDVGALVYASSIGAYSPGPNVTVDESWPTHGIGSSRYSREKAYVERLLDAFEAETGTRVVRMRPALMFQRNAASEVRRFFLGSLFVNGLARPGRVPLFPTVDGLSFQAVHADDVAEAYRTAVLDDGVAGAFNLAAEPVLDLGTVARVLDARPVRVPARVLRPAAALTWRLRLHPVSPGWVELAFQSPLMSSERARDVLGWEPTTSSTTALAELLGGIADGAGAPTPTLRPDAESSRGKELATRQGAIYSRDDRTA